VSHDPSASTVGVAQPGRGGSRSRAGVRRPITSSYRSIPRRTPRRRSECRSSVARLIRGSIR